MWCRTGKSNSGQLWRSPEEGYRSWIQGKMERTPGAALWEPSARSQRVSQPCCFRSLVTLGLARAELKNTNFRRESHHLLPPSCHGQCLTVRHWQKHLHFPLLLPKTDGSYTDLSGQTQELLLNSEAPWPNLEVLISCDLPTDEWLLSLKWCSDFTLQECTEYWFEVAKTLFVLHFCL